MKSKAFIYIILAGMLWGTSGIFVKFLSPYGFTAPQLSLIRGTVSFISMLLYALVFDRKVLKIKAKHLIFVLLIGMALFGTATLYYSSMTMTSVSTAVVLMYTAPIYVTAFSMLFLGESSSKLKIFSIAIMLIGCGFVSGIIGGLKFNAIGILLGVLSGIVYAFYNIMTKIALSKGLNAITLSLYSFMFMSLCALLMSSPPQIIENALEKPIITIPLMIGIGVFTFVLPYFFYTLSMRDLSAGTASALGIIEPLSATIFSAVIFGEIPGVISLIGIILIVLATVLLGKSDNEAVKDNK